MGYLYWPASYQVKNSWMAGWWFEPVPAPPPPLILQPMIHPDRVWIPRKRKSSFILDTEYDAATQILRIKFDGGYEHDYFVSQATHEKMQRASSLGKFFHAHIKHNRKK